MPARADVVAQLAPANSGQIGVWSDRIRFNIPKSLVRQTDLAGQHLTLWYLGGDKFQIKFSMRGPTLHERQQDFWCEIPNEYSIELCSQSSARFVVIDKTTIEGTIIRRKAIRKASRRNIDDRRVEGRSGVVVRDIVPEEFLSDILKRLQFVETNSTHRLVKESDCWLFVSKIQLND